MTLDVGYIWTHSCCIWLNNEWYMSMVSERIGWNRLKWRYNNPRQHSPIWNMAINAAPRYCKIQLLGITYLSRRYPCTNSYDRWLSLTQTWQEIFIESKWRLSPVDGSNVRIYIDVLAKRMKTSESYQARTPSFNDTVVRWVCLRRTNARHCSLNIIYRFIWNYPLVLNYIYDRN